MFKRRRSRPTPASPLDSLLDTLFNFAGILVIVIILIQLNAGEAIRKLLPADFAHLKQNQVELAAARQALDEIQENADDLAVQIQPAQEAADAKAEQLEVAERQIRAARQQAAHVANAIPDIDGPQGELEQAEQALSGRKLEAAAIDKQKDAIRQLIQQENLKLLRLIAALQLEDVLVDPRQMAAQVDHANQLFQLDAQLGTAQKNLDQAQAKLRETRLKISQKNRLRVPIPRDPPAGATKLVFLCQNGRIVDGTNVDELRAQFKKEYAAFLNDNKERIDLQYRLDPNALDRDRFVMGKVQAHFQANPISNLYLQLDFRKLAWVNYTVKRFGNGENEEQVRAPDSSFRRHLQALPNRARVYIQFLVRDDSFPVYLEARAIADELGFKCGWEPHASTGGIGFSLNDRLAPGTSIAEDID